MTIKFILRVFLTKKEHNHNLDRPERYLTPFLSLPPLKMMFCENVVFEAQFKNSFISWKSRVPFLTNSLFYVLNHSINFKSYDVMISISTRARGYS